MANWSLNWAIITHDDKVKVSDLYRISAGDFFNFILPTPIELCNEDTLRDKKYNLEAFGADNLSDWRLKNWGNRCPPLYDWTKRTLSKNGDYMTISFDTKWIPAFGVYEELQRQGYRVKAYFWDPYGCNCGSYIYGTIEFIQFGNGDKDIPPDIDMMFRIEEYEKIHMASKDYDDKPCILAIHDEGNDMTYFQGTADKEMVDI